MKKNIKKPAKLNKGNYLIDTHCHLDMQHYSDDLNEILDQAQESNISSIISIGIDEKSSQRAIELARQYEMIFATVGIHPHDVDNMNSTSLQFIAQLAQENQPFVVGYGEIGLDYKKKYSSPESQRNLFKTQLSLAKELQLPVIIHDRDAHDDTLAILKQSAPFDNGGVMHCFSGDYNFAKRVIDLGLHISIPGIVTFKNSHLMQDVATNIPLPSLLLETDGPFLAPEPCRGKRNEPHYILYTAEKIAQLRNMNINELAQQTTRNAHSLFRLSN